MRLNPFCSAHGLEKEFDLLSEASDRIIDGDLEQFDASVDPRRFRAHKPEPDCYRNVTELITSKGYGCEEHYTVTSDGYVLALQRICKFLDHLNLNYSQYQAIEANSPSKSLVFKK